MGVKRLITLEKVQVLFPEFTFTYLSPTTDGVMDTTYISDNYVLKFYEREIKERIEYDAKNLQKLQSVRLHVPRLVATSKGWYLYEKLQGATPKSTSYFHITALARFLAKLHTITYKKKTPYRFLEEYNLGSILQNTQRNHYFYYKKLQSLQSFMMQEDGFIHGDIFKDNTLFDEQKLGVIDFIDSGSGSFSFDLGVSLISFNPKQKSSLQKLFLETYNQHAPKKITPKELQKAISDAAKIYALLRIHTYKNPQKAKLLANLW